MESFEITGGIPLYGEVQIQGSKNAALPILAAAVLIEGTTVLYNCPRIIDIMYMIQILESLGCVVSWEDTHILRIDASNITGTVIPESSANKMRSSITLLGSLLSRKKSAEMPYPGGCVIGDRPIGMHLHALTKMGVVIETEESRLYASADRLTGAEVRFQKNSVGATENAVLAAVLAEGTTHITGAAKEPEITELCLFLKNAGADISGIGTDKLIINGVNRLKETVYRIAPDRIVAGTYLFAVAATKGAAVLKETPAGQLAGVLSVAREMGIAVKEEADSLFIDATDGIRAVPYVETKEYPGFPTDLQSVLLSALSLAEGKSIVKETIFDARFRTAGELQRMGAEIRIDETENTAFLTGVPKLTGTDVYAKELRGGAALAVAGLAADGVTAVHNLYYIRRGYENIERDLRSLGGNIRG